MIAAISKTFLMNVLETLNYLEEREFPSRFVMETMVIKMNDLISRYCPRIEFSTYKDLKKNYRCVLPENFNFAYDIVDEWAKIDPDKQALVWTNDECEMKRFSFCEMKVLSDRAANVFKAFGIKKGDVVMLILKQRPEVWVCMVALMKIGAICIPASYQLTSKDITYRCNIASVKMIVSVDDDEIIRNIKSTLSECAALQKVLTVGDNPTSGFIDFRSELARASDIFTRPSGENATCNCAPMLIYFSSGTTGLPKMVWHDFAFPLGHIVTAKYWQCVQENQIHLTQTDSGWAKFAWGKIFGQWICSAVIGAYDTEKFIPHALLDAIMRIKPATFCAPATIYRFLIKEDLSGYDLSFIKHASIAGEPLNPEVYRKICELTGLELHEGFGQSESSVLLANFPWIEVRPGSMGKPSPLYNIDLMDADGNSCEDGIVGSIVVKGTDTLHPLGLFRGYWRDAETTAKLWHDGVYNTGDMAWRDADGYYWFVGRNDDVIKCSGYRIGPFEVESALLEHPSVLECAVTAAPDPVRGQVVKATIVLARGFESSGELIKELQNHVKKTTAPYKYPRIIEFVSELPKTVSGKIQRNLIRKTDHEKQLE
jgi:acetyl-CoA synthetase